MVAAIIAITFFVYVWFRLPELQVISRADRNSFLKVGKFAFSIFTYQTITSLLLIFERVYVLRTFGSEALTYYVVPLMLGIYLHAFIVSFSQVAVPEINERITNRERLLAFYKLANKSVLAVTTLFISGYWVFGKAFLTLWLGNDFESRSFTLLVIHGTAFGIIAISINCWILAEATHFSGLNALSASVTALLAINVSWIAAAYYGMEGIAAGRLIGAIAVLPLIPLLEKKVFGNSMFLFWVDALARVVVAAGVSVLFARIAVSSLQWSWSNLLISTAMFASCFVVILLLLRFRPGFELRELDSDSRD
ncbi:MAG: lipopolysaccharide biosynthesis protein [Pyrinomonadaceae bacterium]